MVDTVNDARIHIAAAIDSTVANERIFCLRFAVQLRLVTKLCRKSCPVRSCRT